MEAGTSHTTLSSEQSDLRSFESLLRRQLPVILLVAVLTAAGTLLVSLTREEKYQATSRILYLDPGTGPSLSADSAERAVATFVRLATTEEVLRRVAEEQNASTEVLRKQITVDGSSDANIISIKAVADTAAGAAGIANATATSLVNWRTEQRQRQVRARIEFLRQQLATLAGKTAPSEVAAAADLRTQLAQALAELNVPSPELTIVSPAQVPTEPFTPKPVRDGFIGLLAGLVLGVFLAAVRDRLDRRLRSVEHIEEQYPYPLLGIVPHVPGSDLKTKVIDADPHSVLADAYRTIRTNLMLVTQRNEKQENQRGDVWVISSAVSGEGKSAAVANLSRALAASGLDVLAISGDLHKPVLHRYFGVAVGRWAGLPDVLVGATTLEQTARPVYRSSGVAAKQGSVSLLGNEATFADPGVLYQSPAMGRLLEEARDIYDVILIDTSPVLVTGEASLLARLADGMIMIARLDHVTRHQGRRTARALATVGVRPMGVIVTGYRESEAYYGYGYRPAADTNGRVDDGLDVEPPARAPTGSAGHPPRRVTLGE
jgi:succinoglycan biosynthesis transport protein ExoP